MSNMIVRLIVNAASTAFVFGLWQQNIYAGLWMMTIIGCFYSAIDYFKEQPK
jgi:hypothetical protein